MAMVVRTGFRTAKGELVRSILYPKPMKFKFTQDALKFVAALGGLSVLGFAVSVFLMHRSGVETGRIVLRALDLITIVVPPALPVAMTVAIVFAQRRLRGHNIYCINPSAINVCGVINVACFDKTGTLTEDGMDLWGVVPNNQGNFGEPQMKPSEFEHGPLLEAMASCHSLTRIEGVLSGDPLDLKMFQSTKWEFLEEVSEDHCKFEMAVPAIVRPEIKGSLTSVTLDSTIDPDMIPYEIGILRQFPFTSSLQRMSVIARVLNSSYFSVYTKGAPEMLETLCRRDTIPSDYQSVLLEYTREGYRVLALAWRPLKVSYTKVLRIPRERVEQDLLFLGFLVMENRLKPETASVIQVLRNANIRPVMVTGDNMLTAVSVARDCEIIDELDRIIIVSAKPPPKSNSTDVVFNGLSDAAGDVMNPVDPTGFAQQQQQHAPFLISLDQLDGVWPTGSSEPYGFTVSRDHPLVEFHYAEDLHKPVTEVTVTSDGVNGWRNQRVRRRRSDGFFSANGHGKSLFSNWTNCFRKPSDSQPSYGAVPNTALTGFAGVAGSTVAPEIGGAQTCGGSDPPWRASGPNHRVTIRMIDRPDFHLAISGKTWGVIKEHYPWIIPKLGSTITDGQFLFIDLFLITTLSVTYGYTRAYSRLSVEPPSMHLLSTITFMSLGFQLLVNCTLQVVCFIWVRVQPWYIPLYDISYAYELKNYESTVVFIVSVYQYIILAIVFSKGAPYRRSIFTNYFFICNLIGCTGLTLYVTTYPADPILNLLAMVRIPSIRFILILHGVVLANFLACYILELIVDGVSFRRRLLHIRRALFPRHVQIKDYERIREEIDRLAGSWPPIIRSASVQALPRELFHDVDDFTAQNSDGRVRKHTVSGASSDSEDELVSPVQTDFPTETALLQSSPSTEQNANLEFTVGGTTGADPAWKSSRRRRFNSGKLRRPKSLTDLRWESNLSGRPPITTSKADEPGEDAFAPESDISFQPVCPTSSVRRNILVDKRKRSQSSGPCADPVYLPVRGHWTGHDRAAVKKI
ncbi:cation-transporting P-type ATPase 13A3/4/5 [Paragonimus westermani]|uniref:Cation-transporting P-type ATPase 13A3/4/5 n=1 Tax=Paragonimus westermani TaxID=34504 RepID=A0A5J4NF62_9TREM|nr:cation-transporting P-type ATPase 13A3/4/5 [Paragonimus westermani]